ncbi:DsbA family protein [Crocinitomix catalasitica]|uniref:DsbA family protein n=1 Tax=Crocinitomix catalasitica TaxID=184607 RepID=UPI00068539F1|nr:DsbA family protein [Crocinitomix catalasitica]
MTNFDWLETEENTIIYIGDTMCSWCYGFAPELDKFISNHKDYKVRIVNGGLRPGNTEKINTMSDFLKSHWVEINERTGQPFSYKILEDVDFIYDTEPGSRAVMTVRQMNPAIELDFFKAVQTAFYKDNLNTSKLDTFLQIASGFNLDLKEFEALYNSEETKYLTKADFQLSSEMGIKGFPSMIIKRGKEFTLLSNGFREVTDLEDVYNKITAI